MTGWPHKIVSNQRGSVINVALLILILIFLVGIGLNKISTTDIKIATNIKTDTITFYEAESGLDAAADILELNIPCSLGFSDTPTASDGLPDGWEKIAGMVTVTNLTLWRNEAAGDPTGNPDPDDKDALPEIDAFYPPDYDGSEEPDAPHTNFSIGGTTRFSRGAAIQMAAGYEGLGKGAGGGGASIIYDVLVQRYGSDKSEALHMIQWVHKLGLGGSCQF